MVYWKIENTTYTAVWHPEGDGEEIVVADRGITQLVINQYGALELRVPEERINDFVDNIRKVVHQKGVWTLKVRDHYNDRRFFIWVDKKEGNPRITTREYAWWLNGWGGTYRVDTETTLLPDGSWENRHDQLHGEKYGGPDDRPILSSGGGEFPYCKQITGVLISHLREIFPQ